MSARSEKGWKLLNPSEAKDRQAELGLSDVKLADAMGLTDPSTAKRLLKGQFGLRRNCVALLKALNYSDDERRLSIIHKEDLATINFVNTLGPNFEAKSLVVTQEVSRSNLYPHDNIGLLSAPLTLADYKAQLREIPAGAFEREGFTITLTEFCMGRVPVTVGMWQEYAEAMLNGRMPELPKFPVWKDGWDAVREHPIVRVSWEECLAYANWAGLSLPTEAQWEYVARGGLSDRLYPWGNDELATQLWWTPVSADKGTAPVDRTDNIFINPYGIVDLAGNVWEWCIDVFGPYESGHKTDPVRIGIGEYRALRGGSWGFYDEDVFRCSVRTGVDPLRRSYAWGFRLCSISSH